MVVVDVPAVVVVVVCWYGLLLFRWIIYSDGPNVNIIYTYLIYIYINIYTCSVQNPDILALRSNSGVFLCFFILPDIHLVLNIAFWCVLTCPGARMVLLMTFRVLFIKAVEAVTRTGALWHALGT